MSFGPLASGPTAPEGLRERKKRQMRQLISDTATEMFLERGFDKVRVAEVAECCGVSEKTVYNYFPTKESLLLDRQEDMEKAIRSALGPGSPSRSPIQATLEVLAREHEELSSHWADLEEAGQPAGPVFRRFAELIETTPSLRAAQRDFMDRMVQVAAEALAERVGTSPSDPEPQIAATAIVGLWRLQFQALRARSDDNRGFEEVWAEVQAEVARGARLIDSGLWAFEVMAQGRGTRDQLAVAAEAAQKAGRQVAATLRQARTAWAQAQAAVHGGPRPQASHEDPRHWQRAQRGQVQEDVAEWKQAQRELKQQYIKAQREQAKLLRERIKDAQRGHRSRGRGGAMSKDRT